MTQLPAGRVCAGPPYPANRALGASHALAEGLLNCKSADCRLVELPVKRPIGLAGEVVEHNLLGDVRTTTSHFAPSVT